MFLFPLFNDVFKFLSFFIEEIVFNSTFSFFIYCFFSSIQKLLDKKRKREKNVQNGNFINKKFIVLLHARTHYRIISVECTINFEKSRERENEERNLIVKHFAELIEFERAAFKNEIIYFLYSE